MTQQTGQTAVITGAASGFGLEASRIAARRGMNVVMADVQPDALTLAAHEIEGLGAQVLTVKLDVSKAAEVEALGAATLQRFGAPHFVFNNAGVGAGGLIWEHTLKDWEWVVGVNLMGVAHGVRVFTPMMLAAAENDPAYRGHIVNTASMAGLLNAPNMGVYNVTKHAVVSMSETLYQDLALVSEQVHAHVLCPFFVPTGIHKSERNRPADMPVAPPTRSQLIAQAMSEKAVSSGKVTAAQVAQFVFDAMDENRFYVFSHPKSLASVQTRLEDLVSLRNPTDPFKGKPEIGAQLKAALREKS
jgi:NAD(P)-dependent dehydrogenase (short-subunit alcohol dehydrogenase family)